MIIDFHTHIFPRRIVDSREDFVARDPLFKELYSNPKATLASAEDLISKMDELGIDRSVALNIQWSSPELCRETNDYISESVAKYSGRLIGFGMVTLDSPEITLKEIERCAWNGLRGIGEIRPTPQLLKNTALLEPVIRKMIEKNLVLLTHASEPVGHIYPGKGDITSEALYTFISAFPGLKLVCAHWGGGLPFYALMPEVKKALENVYFDSAASPYLYKPQVYNQVSQLIGSDRILFGSDYPLLSPQRLLNEIKSQDIPEETKEKILSGNAQALLGLK